MTESKLNFSAGDYVLLRLAKKEIEGRILESYDKEIILIKLKSGYNIGIARENILDFKVLKKFKEDVKNEIKTSFDDHKKTIGLIVTGGTIASKLDAKTGGVTALAGVDEFAKFYPKLFEKVNVKMEIPFMELSENMNWKHWIKIAEITKKMLNDKDIEGVIITHGSDFLHYTSSILSFFLKDLNKPVVLTFSQRSIDRASSDAEMNLDCAVSFALGDCAEVVIVGHASTNDDFCYALQGNKVRKMHTSRRDTFKAVNTREIAKVFRDKIEFLREYKPRNNGKTELDCSFNDKIALVKFYPGQDEGILDYYLKEKYKGIIIEMSGLGHVNIGWIAKIKKLVKSGLFVFAVSQTIYGRLNPKVYSTGRELEKAGVIFLGDMLSETAFVKLGFVLGHKNWRSREKVREKMLGNFSGEFNELLSE
ncbi:MAG: Glu-tRNA(Gln) amidotransferase subunit GatD [Candidatus Pacearchaeota archaeon]|nr:Glu-tRNA(Gln) amidotransferase subunit GatD [Candidatus Pacearchaeota archaeon]